MKRSADVLNSHHSHTSSAPPASSFPVTLHMPIIHGLQSSPWGHCGPFAKGLEPLIGPTTSHLAPDHWIQYSNTQHWSGNRLSSSTELSSLKHARGNGNVHHRTSHNTMMMYAHINLPALTCILYCNRTCYWQLLVFFIAGFRVVAARCRSHSGRVPRKHRWLRNRPGSCQDIAALSDKAGSQVSYSDKGRWCHSTRCQHQGLHRGFEERETGRGLRPTVILLTENGSTLKFDHK